MFYLINRILILHEIVDLNNDELETITKWAESLSHRVNTPITISDLLPGELLLHGSHILIV